MGSCISYLKLPISCFRLVRGKRPLKLAIKVFRDAHEKDPPAMLWNTVGGCVKDVAVDLVANLRKVLLDISHIRSPVVLGDSINILSDKHAWRDPFDDMEHFPVKEIPRVVLLLWACL